MSKNEETREMIMQIVKEETKRKRQLEEQKKLEKIIEKILKEIGAPTVGVDYERMVFTIILCYQDVRALMNLRKYLYPTLVKEFHLTIYEVEGFIRRYMDKVLYSGDIDKVYQFFGEIEISKKEFFNSIIRAIKSY